MRALYASDPTCSRGRRIPETEYSFRSSFQRDRDRIIHASAFRRLKHKTQVFVEHEGDNYRTRLTHSIEVAQVARTVAGALGLDLDLTEAVALAHDLGHTPFGHTGEDALAEMMTPYGGFDHNAQTVRIVTRLEQHYADFDGLNLTWETLEAIAKHNGPVLGTVLDPVNGTHEGAPRQELPRELPRGLPWALAACQDEMDLELHTYASAEAQVAALADDIAYNNHDLHDGLRAGLFTDADIMELPLVGDAYREVDEKYPNLQANRRRHEALRRVFGKMVADVIKTSQEILDRAQPRSVSEVRDLGRPVIQFSDAMYADLKVIRRFLFTRMYRAPSVMVIREQVTQVVKDLFSYWMANPLEMPARWHGDIHEAMDAHHATNAQTPLQGNQNSSGKTALARLVSDYVSGMTDRFALREHQRLGLGP
jgi:dGTPase